MKDQFKINPLGFEMVKIKKEKSRLSKILLICIFAATTIISLATVVVFWSSTIFEDAILASLALKNDTQTFTWWKRPPVKPLLRVKIFNYTNLEEYTNGNATKLRVEEVGPYIYRETLTRENVKLHENGTVTYQEKTTHKWEGGRSDNEIVRVPNVPLLVAVDRVKNSHYTTQLGATLFLSAVQAKPFKIITVKEYLWGYSDNLINMASQIMSVTNPMPYDKFGMLVARDGLSEDRITIHTGSGDINKLGLYDTLNGMKSRNVWHDKECDKVQGTDGSMFPPNLVKDRNATLNIYTRDMCRTFPVRFDSYNTSFDIPSLRYKPPKDVFTTSNTTNSCFCQKTSQGSNQKLISCPPAGTFNSSACSYGLPFLISFPHFYHGDKSLLNEVEGLNPEKDLHETYIDLHPRLGVPIGGWSRIQVNIQVSVVRTVPMLGTLKDGMILPIMWFEIGIDDMPESVLSLLRHAYFTAGFVERSLQWGSLLCTILSIYGMAYMTKRYMSMERNQPAWQSTISLNPGL